MPGGIGENGKFNIFGHGEAFNRGVVGDATIEFIGSGLVGTAYGYPGLTATLIGTGLVELRYPTTAIRGARFYPHPMGAEPKGPTGAFVGPQGSGALPNFAAHMSHVGGQSGSAYLNLTTNSPTPTAVGGATGLRPINAPTGAVVNLLVVASPIRRY